MQRKQPHRYIWGHTTRNFHTMYNPYSEAFKALSNAEARRFYADTALEHSFLTLTVTAIAAQRTYEAG